MDQLTEPIPAPLPHLGPATSAIASPSFRGQPSPGRARRNRQWLHELRSSDPRVRDAALEELCRYLRSSLARAFGSDPSVQDPDLEDFTQDAVVRILRALDSFRGDSKFTTWALAVALRVAYSSLRKRRSDRISLTDVETWPGTRELYEVQRERETGRGLERNSLFKALYKAISHQLTERQRTAVLAELQGATSERVATMLGTTRNALYKLHHDARRKLRRALTDEGFTHEDVRELLDEAS